MHPLSPLTIGIDVRECRNPGGVGKYIRDLVTELQDDPTLRLILFYDRPVCELPIAINGTTEVVCFVPKRSWFWEQVWLPSILMKMKLPLYHATFNFGLPWHFPGKRVVTIHDVIPIYFPEVMPLTLRRRKLVYSVRLDGRLADHIITDSLSSKQDIVRSIGVKPDKVTVIWPVVMSKLSESQIRAKVMERSLQIIETSEKYILHNGGMDPRKNIEGLLEAFRLFVSDGKKRRHKLIITGRSDTEFAVRMKRLAGIMGLSNAVIFTGKLSSAEIHSLIANAEFCVYPSFYEGFGLPVIEAMSMGTPVVAADVSSIPEVAGGAALLIDPRDVKSLYRAMARMADSPTLRQGMARAGLSWIKANQERDMAIETSRVYRAVIS